MNIVQTSNGIFIKVNSSVVSTLTLKPKEVRITNPFRANICENSLGKKLKTLVNIFRIDKIFFPL